MAWTLTLAVCTLAAVALAAPFHNDDGLRVELSVVDGLLNRSTDGRIILMFAPAGIDPLDDYDVTSSPDQIFGKNAFKLQSPEAVTLSGGSNFSTDLGVWGWPNVSMNDLPAQSYSVQAFLTRYETQMRSDGSTVSVRFPCGDGAPSIDGPGSLKTSITNVTVTGGSQTIELAFDNITAGQDFNGSEIGGCHQGNYEDTTYLKYVKIRSEKLSRFWGRDMFVGANVVLPHGYNTNDTAKRYPVIYSQGHWPGDGGAFRYSRDEAFASAWNEGVVNANSSESRPTPKLILVTFRHETPFYDDSYAVNNANMGPWGDAINEELIPYIDQTFNTIAQPYARIQEGGSTGGWDSAANLIFRPDLFGACFSSYPDSLDFHRHQAIPLYTAENAYQLANGSIINSIRTFENDTEVILASTAQENHWELTFGTSSRSFLQWDVWQTVFGVQGYNNYPLEAWDKVTGEIYPGAVEYWKHMDLAHYITSNWDGEKNLGENLRNRIFVYVGERDDYFLNGGVHEFDSRVTAKGGPGWANFTYIAQNGHGGNYQDREIWDYLELLSGWIEDHSPEGATPLPRGVTVPSARGNYWEEVLAYGGREAAVARQASPVIYQHEKPRKHDTSALKASVGRWDPGMSLEAVWLLDSKPSCQPFAVMPEQTVTYERKHRWSRHAKLQLAVTGRKRGYETETRKSEFVWI
ncbi:hypothetical protein B0A50_06939 [Salinomyces thailandicus]|uniref:Alpha/Beta hydrolase protein n=1 Tax=Salinomyces thailandicus TaxID=706561 RepID=A0A4U0TPR0_9PEZI|nr:hypothetical protein B0A50_06939 [Salinomyces thailandica]